jgi:hypothetical protein
MLRGLQVGILFSSMQWLSNSLRGEVSLPPQIGSCDVLVHGVEYTFFTASHVTKGHDGLAIECWRGNDLVFDIFRNDETLRFEVTLFEQDVPLELFEHAIPIARASLGGFAP